MSAAAELVAAGTTMPVDPPSQPVGGPTVHPLTDAAAALAGSPWWTVPALVLLALVAVAVYVAACRWWPYRACPRCDGSGKRRSPGGKTWRRCRRCKGSGTVLRIGRLITNHMTKIKTEGNR